MRILITGSQGHIGKNLVKGLKELGHQILRMDVVQLYQDDYIMCNLTNLSDAYSVIDEFKPQVIYHLAAAVSRVTSQKSPYNAFLTNVCGTVGIVQLALKYKAKLINFSTSQIYGDLGFNDDTLSMYDYRPNNVYGVSKWMGQFATKYYENDIVVINLRPHMIYDPNERMVDNRSALIRFVKSALLNEDIHVHQNSYRGWLHMRDAIQLIINAMYLQESVSLNIGNGDIRSVYELAEIIINNVKDCKSTIIRTLMPQKMCQYKCPNLHKQYQLLKYTPKVTLEQGIVQVINSAKLRLNNE